MKIRVSKLFDEGNIEDEELRQNLAPLIGHINSSFDNIISALRKEVTLDDNLKGFRRTISMRHDTATTQVISGTFIGAIPLHVEASGIGIESYTIRQPSGTQLEFTVQFTDTATTARDVRWFIFTE